MERPNETFASCDSALRRAEGRVHAHAAGRGSAQRLHRSQQEGFEVTYRTATWMYVAGGAAVGLVALGALKRRRGSVAELAADTPARDNPVSTIAPRRAANDEKDDDTSDIPSAVRESLAASARSHGLHRPISAELAREIAAQAADQRQSSGEGRQEVSSLFGPMAFAPDPDAMGEELLDPGAIEVPIGQSADPEIDHRLSHAKLPQPDSTGAALQKSETSVGVHSEGTPDFEENTTDPMLTAQPMHEPPLLDDAYDALAPDDLGSEWLARATEASPYGPEEDFAEAQPPELLYEVGMAIVSEGSLNAASADALEAAAIADLEGLSESEQREIDEPLSRGILDDDHEADEGDRATDPTGRSFDGGAP